MEMPMSKTESTFGGVSITVGMLNKGKEGIYVCQRLMFPLPPSQSSYSYFKKIQRPAQHRLPTSSLSSRSRQAKDSILNNDIIINMQTQVIMGRGGYNRISSPALGRGGYNRDVKTSGISRPSNPSSLTVRSARANNDGRGGYN
jgi:hypothetical protein